MVLEWLVVGGVAAAAAGAGASASLARRRAIHARWGAALHEVAERIGGRASPGSMFDAPELRAEQDGLDVTVRLLDLDDEARAGVTAEVALPDRDNRVRFFFGWDLPGVPDGWDHVPEVEYPGLTRLDGTVRVRAESSELSAGVLAASVLDLTDVRREARAESVAVTTRGGYLALSLGGIIAAPVLLERMVDVAARLSRVVDAVAKGEPPPPRRAEVSAVPPDVRCELCAAGPGDGRAWVRCARCRTPYHAECHRQATGCLVPDCKETRAVAP